MSAVAMSAESARWHAVERTGWVWLVRSIGEEVVVEFDDDAWHCSDHGAFPLSGRKSGVNTCEHVMAATRHMPLDVALEIVAVIAPPKPAKNPSPKGAKTDDESAGGIPGAVARAERNAIHDDQFGPTVGEVTVRQMTDADRQKLAEARARKRKKVGRADRDEQVQKYNFTK